MSEQLGTCYRELSQRDQAIDYFKCALSLAWELLDEDAEFRAYESLALEYFYSGDIEKA